MEIFKDIFDAIINIMLVVVVGFWFGVGMYFGVTLTMRLFA